MASDPSPDGSYALPCGDPDATRKPLGAMFRPSLYHRSSRSCAVTNRPSGGAMRRNRASTMHVMGLFALALGCSAGDTTKGVFGTTGTGGSTATGTGGSAGAGGARAAGTT